MNRKEFEQRADKNIEKRQILDENEASGQQSIGGAPNRRLGHLPTMDEQEWNLVNRRGNIRSLFDKIDE